MQENLNRQEQDSIEEQLIALQHVRKCYEGQVVLEDFSMTLSKGKVYFLSGISGQGKTTLMRLLLGLEAPEAGEIQRRPGMRMSAVFQEDRLLEEFTVARNLRLVMGADRERRRGGTRQEILREIRTALSAIGLADHEHHRVSTLSGGMKRRVAILRALLREADLYLFDEACQGLDPETRDRTMNLILSRTAGKTLLWITHNLDEISYFRNCEREIEMLRLS